MEIVGFDMIAVSIERSCHSIQELVNHWSHIWSLTFSGRASSAICIHCFSTSHSSRDCKLNSSSNPSDHLVSYPSSKTQSFTIQTGYPSCFDWNDTPVLGSPQLACHFDHIVTTVCATHLWKRSHTRPFSVQTEHLLMASGLFQDSSSDTPVYLWSLQMLP